MSTPTPRVTPQSFDDSPIPHRRVLFVLIAMQVTHIVDFMLLMPLGGMLMRIFSLTPAQFSVAVASYTLAAGISSLLFAGFADRFDRKRLLLTVYAGLACATLACAFAPNFETLLAARVCAGIFGGLMSAVVYAIVGDLIPLSHRGRAMGLVGVSFPLASTLGVPFSLFLATHLFGWHAPFVALVLIAVVLWVLAWRNLPQVRAHLDQPQVKTVSAFQTLIDVLKVPNHLTAFALTAMVTFSGFSVIPFLAPILTKNGMISEQMVAVAYALGGAATFFSVQRIGRWSDQFGHLRVFRWFCLIACVPIGVITHMQNAPVGIVLAVWLGFTVLVSARFTPSLALVTSASAGHSRGAFLSVNSALMQLSSSAATFVSGNILVNNANGTIGHFQYVGAMSIMVALLAYGWAARVRAAPIEPLKTAA